VSAILTQSPVIPEVPLYLIKFPPKWYYKERILIFSCGLLIFFAMLAWGTELAVQLVISLISFGALVIYWIGFAIIYEDFPE
jgi:hypothetical protein